MTGPRHLHLMDFLNQLRDGETETHPVRLMMQMDEGDGYNVYYFATEWGPELELTGNGWGCGVNGDRDGNGRDVEDMG